VNLIPQPLLPLSFDHLVIPHGHFPFSLLFDVANPASTQQPPHDSVGTPPPPRPAEPAVTHPTRVHVAPLGTPAWRQISAGGAPRGSGSRAHSLPPCEGAQRRPIVDFLQWCPIGKAELWSRSAYNTQSALAPSWRPHQ
jgi:hypothetical protein